MLNLFDDGVEDAPTPSPLVRVLRDKLRSSYMVAVRDNASGNVIHFDTRFGWDLDRFARSVEQMEDFEVLEPPQGPSKYQKLRGLTRLEKILNWHIENKRSFVVRDNYDRGYLYEQTFDPDDPLYTHNRWQRSLVFSFPCESHHTKPIYRPDTSKEIRDLIEEMGWFDIETVRYGESWQQCIKRLPKRWIN